MTVDELIQTLLKSRGLDSPELVDGFFHPPDPLDIPLSDVGLSDKYMSAAVSLVNSYLVSGQPVAVYGDYDVDGITSTAIVWETLYSFSKAVFPHIPHRRDEGYGLSVKGIDHCLEQGAKLIICVDNGIVALNEVAYCKQHGCDIIIIDHHQPGKELPQADSILHTTATSAAGIAWFFARELLQHPSPELRRGLPAGKAGDGGEVSKELLSLTAISVICDLVPLLGVNRSLVKFGLAELNQTARPGLLALFQEAGLLGESYESSVSKPIGTYEVGYIIGPRLNAMGRLEHALDSLRLICTTDPKRAGILAQKLGDTNKLRQDMTAKSSELALSSFSVDSLPPVLLVSDAGFDEGIIGLVASKLVEKYYRPAIAVSVGPEISKASARSIPGFHITDFLRQFSDILSSVGGHAMAAGFTVSTANLELLKDRLLKTGEKVVDPALFVRNRRVDAEVPLDILGLDLYLRLQDFAPFGLGNPKPVFLTKNVSVYSPRRVGKEFKHLKFTAGSFAAIYFNAARGVEDNIKSADLVYSLESNTYAGRTSLQLVVRELEPAEN
jgi:single-stranded-DNA-specific exonuclease